MSELIYFVPSLFAAIWCAYLMIKANEDPAGGVAFVASFVLTIGIFAVTVIIFIIRLFV